MSLRELRSIFAGAAEKVNPNPIEFSFMFIERSFGFVHCQSFNQHMQANQVFYCRHRLGTDPTSNFENDLTGGLFSCSP
jgi:hypothetical protein